MPDKLPFSPYPPQARSHPPSVRRSRRRLLPFLLLAIFALIYLSRSKTELVLSDSPVIKNQNDEKPLHHAGEDVMKDHELLNAGGYGAVTGADAKKEDQDQEMPKEADKEVSQTKTVESAGSQEEPLEVQEIPEKKPVSINDLDSTDDRIPDSDASSKDEVAVATSLPEAESPKPTSKSRLVSDNKTLASTNSTKVTLDAHIMSKCPDARDCLRDMIVPAMEEISELVSFNMSFIGKAEANGQVHCMHGPEECLGNTLILCAQDLYPESTIRSLGFANCMISGYKDIPSRAHVENCALEHGISFDKLNDCASDTDKGERLLQEAVEWSRSEGVKYSCTVRVAGETWCVRDGGEWKDCDGGSEVKDLVKKVKKLAKATDDDVDDVDDEEEEEEATKETVDDDDETDADADGDEEKIGSSTKSTSRKGGAKDSDDEETSSSEEDATSAKNTTRHSVKVSQNPVNLGES